MLLPLVLALPVLQVGKHSTDFAGIRGRGGFRARKWDKRGGGEDRIPLFSLQNYIWFKHTFIGQTKKHSSRQKKFANGKQQQSHSSRSTSFSSTTTSEPKARMVTTRKQRPSTRSSLALEQRRNLRQQQHQQQEEEARWSRPSQPPSSAREPIASSRWSRSLQARRRASLLPSLGEVGSTRL